MLLIYGSILLAFCVIYFNLVLIAARNPLKKGWMGKPIMMESVHLFLLLGSAVMGPVLMIKGVIQLDSLSEIATALAALAAIVFLTVIIVRKMDVKARLARFAAMEERPHDAPLKPLGNSENTAPVDKAA